ncbi:MAG: 2Fe-2S iron-sulfur cluster binding domain-containing protein [Ideonella sp.]|nr:2Fe-2S iron-sulfur cluster binding domain-containing protein [Ideonella sp.]
MPPVTVLPPPERGADGPRFELRRGGMLCQGLLDAGVAIEHACDMVSACATCHVLIRQGADSLKPPDDEENDELDHAWGLEPDSRLACCVKLGTADITVELPRHTRNHARER